MDSIHYEAAASMSGMALCGCDYRSFPKTTKMKALVTCRKCLEMLSYNRRT